MREFVERALSGVDFEAFPIEEQGEGQGGREEAFLRVRDRLTARVVVPGKEVHFQWSPADGEGPMDAARAWLHAVEALPGVRVSFSRTAPDGRLAGKAGPDAGVLAEYLRAAVWLLSEREPGARGVLTHARWRAGSGGAEVALIDSPPLRKAMQIDLRLSQILESLAGGPVPVRAVRRDDLDEAVRAFQRSVEAQAAEAGREQAVGRELERPVLREAARGVPETGKRADRAQGASDAAPAITPISSIADEMRRAAVRGRVFGLEARVLPGGRTIHQFHVTDELDSITCKLFSRNTKRDVLPDWLEDGAHAVVRGSVQFDAYARELVLQVADLKEAAPDKRTDDAPKKRVELHAHTQMSALDGVVSAAELVRRAAEYGHAAVAVTDHGVLQAFPDAHEAAKSRGIKVIYGVEAYLIASGQPIVDRPGPMEIGPDTTFVVFDTETTGLSATEHELIEIAGVRMKGGEVIGDFAQLIRPKSPIPKKITELTGISNEMVAGSPPVEEVLPRFREFCDGAVLVAHNAEFDAGFLSVNARRCGVPPFDMPLVDTLALARALFPGDRNHRLKTLTQKFGVTLANHHRALADAEATGRVFYRMLEAARGSRTVATLADLATLAADGAELARARPNHATILVRDPVGLKNLYRLVSMAHLEYFHREPRIPKSLLAGRREGLLIGSGCRSGELWQALLRGKTRDEVRELMDFYDFVELQPLDHYAPLVEAGEMASLDAAAEFHRLLLEVADSLGKPVVATGDVHYLDARQSVYRDIILHSAGGARESSRASARPTLDFRTTQEMLDAFSHLGERAREVVVDNPNRIAEQVEPVSPVPDRVFPPILEGADEQVRILAEARAQELYGNPLPAVVRDRLDRELHSIIQNGFAVNYYIAHKLVTKSLQDGYIVGSRGSVGSSLVATFLDITEVNPLMPHYRCPSCRHSEFVLDGSVGSGYDLPAQDCPHCGARLEKDGQDIPFETFLGFEGDKVPDIDLNFSGEYQARAHRHTEEMFGPDYVFRAGTISTIAEKTAFGYVRKWAEDQGKTLRNAEIQRLVSGCTGIKRTTGQHPGGLIIVPNDREIYDFCPVQYPADDRNSGTRTTHFDFHSIHNNLLKLDILGHDDPTVLRMLADLTGLDARKVPVDDPKVYSLFSGVEALGVTPEAIRSNTGTYGIPEFGTRFVRQMLEDTRPSTFADLVRISGLSHGTDVWLNNAQDLIRNRTAQLREVICCRDDIMVYLIYRGLEPSRAFKIMEKVRKGKGISDEESEYMKTFGVPDWYLASCQRIKYMFPKAHAAAYVLNAVRIAYFKVYRPLEYYAAYFTVRAEDLEIETMVQGADAINLRLAEIEEKGSLAAPKERSLQTALEVALEMTRRGFRFHRLDLYRSEAARFVVSEDGLLPPFAAVAGIGESAAKGIVSARAERAFLSVEDLVERSRISRTVVESLERHGCLEGLPASNQLSLF